ncbi:MAG: hypothetical protein J7I99_03150 [Methanophagales archaeon]|nr:hypothetical protein [Methanophagales archaeon]
MAAARASGSGGERGYTEQATEDLLRKVLEKESREAMQDVLEDRRKITDPDVCNIFNLWYLRKHVNEIRREMHRMDERFERMEHRISMIFTFLGVGFTVLATLITLFQFMG